jgi:hypothetical protein
MWMIRAVVVVVIVVTLRDSSAAGRCRPFFAQ